MPRSIAIVVLSVGLVGYLVLTAIVLRSALSHEEAQVWPGYYGVLVEDGASVEEAERALHQAGFARTLSSDSAQVEFHSFDKIETVRVSDIAARFDPLDPRLDPYMQRVPELFRAYIDGAAYQVIYVRSDQPPLTVLPWIARALGTVEIRAHFPSWNPLGSAASIALSLLFTAIVVWRSKQRRIEVCAGALPWLLTAAVGGPASLPIVLPLLFAWAYAAEVIVPAYREVLRARRPQVESAPLLRRTLLFAFAVTLAIALTKLGGGNINVVPASAAAVLLFFVAAAAEAVRARLQEHRVFTPVSIRRRDMFRKNRGERSAYQAALPWLLGIALTAPFVVLLLPEDRMPLMPQPQRVGSVESISAGALHTLWQSHRENDFPTFADYVAHRAYQSSFMYGSRFSLPTPGETVSLARFTTENGRMSRQEETIMVFDTEWFSAFAGVVGETSLAGLLSQGGSPGGVVRERLHRLYWHPLNVVRQVSLVLLIFVPVMIGQGVLNVAVKRTAIEELARRRRQAA